MTALRMIDAKSPATKLLVARMALHLLRLGATAGEREAIRALSSTDRFRMGDVAALAGDALFVAQQSTLAKTMARSR